MNQPPRGTVGRCSKVLQPPQREDRLFAHRGLRTTVHAITARRHWIALVNMVRVYPKFPVMLWRYVTGRGTYPCSLSVRTPIGRRVIELETYHDLLTVNEIFCRQDYATPVEAQGVLDVGSNIGVSALYFLTRSPQPRCTLIEPDPRNLIRLRANLQGLEARYRLLEFAIARSAGTVTFNIESTGRYGGIGVDTTESIQVASMTMTDAIGHAQAFTPVLDLVKLDIEGLELDVFDSIPESQLRSLGAVHMEASPSEDLRPDLFDNEQYGSVRRLTRRE